MPSKKDQLTDLSFYQYLGYFYKRNKKEIRSSFTRLTKKFLDYNDPKNSDAFLRLPQFQALEIYVFLKEYLDNAYMQDIFKSWYNKEGRFSTREEMKISPGGQWELFAAMDAEVFKTVFDNIKQFKQIYPNYIFALTMGLGKTVLMATSIFYEFLLAHKYPKDPKYCHNALVFAPDKTVLQSLKEIQTFDKSKVIPPEYVSWLDTNLQFHFLDDTGISLNTVDKSEYNIIISNTQKIILKKQHKQKTAAEQLFLDEEKKKIKEINKDYSDLYDFEVQDELELLSNQRFAKLTRLNQLGIYVDEAHHVFGNTLAKDFGLKKSTTSLRITINELAQTLEELGSHVVACYNYTGTPYVNNRLLPEVVYAYGLKKSIDDKYLKKVKVTGFSNIKSDEFIKELISEFWSLHKNKRYENMLPKIAFFASKIDELESELKPAVENALSELSIPLSKILVNVGDEKITSNDDIREFINLDTKASDKQFILLVNKGKEGWNCRSLFAVTLYRKPKSKIFVLQATMRCLRSIGNIQETANVYLSDENLTILQSELQENFRMSVEDINNAGDKKSKIYDVKLVPPPVVIKLKRIKKLYKLNKKEVASKIDLELKKAPVEHYQIRRTDQDIRDIGEQKSKASDISGVKIQREYSAITLVAEIARYLNESPLKIESILKTSKEGLKTIIDNVNKYNELIYDWIIPKLFNEMYDMEEYKSEKEEEVELVKEPADGSGVYQVKADPDKVAYLNDVRYKKFKSKSFHLDHYCFDSNPENALFWTLINKDKIKKVYFTGMLRHGQTDFNIRYIDPESHTLRTYYPDFLTISADGSYEIIEVKGDNKIDDAVVQAKAYYANQMAIASGMTYRVLKGSTAMKGFEYDSEDKETLILFDYDKEKVEERLPLYSLEAAAGKIGNGELIQEEGWLEVTDEKINDKMFICKIKGDSMRNIVQNADYAIFEEKDLFPGEGEIVLVQHKDREDPETGDSCSVKRYYRDVAKKKLIFKDDTDRPQVAVITSFEIPEKEAGNIKIIAGFVGVYNPKNT